MVEIAFFVGVLVHLGEIWAFYVGELWLEITIATHYLPDDDETVGFIGIKFEWAVSGVVTDEFYAVIGELHFFHQH